MSLSFTKYKFLRCPLSLQHKKCAEQLRFTYEALLQKKDPSALINIYHKLVEWMQIKPLQEISFFSLSERYHWHLKNTPIILKEHNLLPSIRRGDRAPKHAFGNCHILLDCLRSAYNVGSILRTTEALRLGSLYFYGNTPGVDNPKVQKTSMGSDKLVPSFHLSSLTSLPRPWIVLDTAEKAVSVNDFIFPSTFTLILGNEELGVSDELLKEADGLVDIPLYGKKNSINVACAFGICAQEIKRQWNLQNISS